MAEIQSLEHLEEFAGEGDVIVVLTQPSNCIPCVRLKPHLARLEEKGYTVAVVDLDTVPEAMVEFGVRSVPRVMLYREGEYVKDLQGRTVQQLQKEV